MEAGIARQDLREGSGTGVIVVGEEELHAGRAGMMARGKQGAGQVRRGRCPVRLQPTRSARGEVPGVAARGDFGGEGGAG